MLRHSISKRRMQFGTRGTSTNRWIRFPFWAFRPSSSTSPSEPRVVETTTVQQALPHHSWWLRRARRAKLVSSGLPLFDGFVVRAGLSAARKRHRQEPCHGVTARKPTLRPHAERGFAIPVSRRRPPLSRDFHPEIPRRVSHCLAAMRAVLEGWRDPLPGSSDPSLAVSCIRRCSRARPTIAHPLGLRPAPSLPDHVNDLAWRRCVESETLALIRFLLPAWRAGDSL